LTASALGIVVAAVPRSSLSCRSFALSLALTGCAGRMRAQPRSTASGATASPFAGDPRIGQYVSSGWTLATSSFWLCGPEGLVLVDTQFLPSGGLEAAALAEQSTGEQC